MSCEKKVTKDSITNTQKKNYKTKRSLSTREEVKQHNRNRKRTKPLWTVYLVAYTSFVLFACIIEYKNDITNAMSWISRRRKKWKKITNASSLFPWYFLNRFACDVPKTRDRFFCFSALWILNSIGIKLLSIWSNRMTHRELTMKISNASPGAVQKETRVLSESSSSSLGK